jgi:hypothetical protein
MSKFRFQKDVELSKKHHLDSIKRDKKHAKDHLKSAKEHEKVLHDLGRAHGHPMIGERPLSRKMKKLTT